MTAKSHLPLIKQKERKFVFGVLSSLMEQSLQYNFLSECKWRLKPEISCEKRDTSVYSSRRETTISSGLALAYHAEETTSIFCMSYATWCVPIMFVRIPALHITFFVQSYQINDDGKSFRKHDYRMTKKARVRFYLNLNVKSADSTAEWAESFWKHS